MTAYDAIADWYETTFLATQREDPLALGPALRELLGPGSGPCLELGCGTGVHAGTIRELGWSPLGVDVSAGMLHHATGRLPVAQGDFTVPGRYPLNVRFADGKLILNPGHWEQIGLK